MHHCSLPAGCPAAQYRQRSFILPEVRPLLHLGNKHTLGSNDGAEDDLLMSVGTCDKGSTKGVKLIDSATSTGKVRGGTPGGIAMASGAPWMLCSSLHSGVLHGPS